MNWFLNIFVLTCLCVTTLYCDDDHPEAKIKQGHIRGVYQKTKNGRKFSAFMSIPYAEPPLGELRFKTAVPGASWEGTKNCDKVHDVCPQRNIYVRSETIEGDEDCLYLNVYTPKIRKSETEVYPVMVWFHGGGWFCGGGNANWYGPGLLLDQDVILVGVNYRLGFLGFLSTGDEVVPGNNGLKDQNLALKWVQENIAQFGGDPNSVTLFGESAGGASAHFHMLSPLSRGLFHAAISQSGTAYVPWGLDPHNEVPNNSKKLAAAFNCPTDSSSRMVECLRTIDALKLIEKDKIFMDWDTDPMIPFPPVIEPKLEGAFLSEHPTDIIKAGKAAKVPWMTGVTTEDGALRGTGICGIPELREEFEKNYDRLAPMLFYYGKTSGQVDHINKEIRRFYLNDQKLDNLTCLGLVDALTDMWFLGPADKAVRLHLKYVDSPVYYYLLGHQGVASFSLIFGDSVNRYGVCHADDLQYLFPVNDVLFPNHPHNALDKRISSIMTTMWANFAKYKNPTPTTNAIIHNKWEPVQSTDLEYLYIGGGVHNGKNMYAERLKFWYNLPIYSKVYHPKDEL